MIVLLVVVAVSATTLFGVFMKSSASSAHPLLREQAVAIARRLAPGPEGTREIDLQRLEIDPEDALLSQLASFVEAVRTRCVRAGAAHEGLSALRTALRVIDAMQPLDDLQ